MLVISCPTHRARLMVPTTHVRQLRNTDTGILLEVECWCGTRVWVRTGRNARLPCALAA